MRTQLTIVMLVFTLALGVRLLGIRLGLPYFHHWDEKHIVLNADSMVKKGNDEPTSYMYGAPIFRIVTRAVRFNAKHEWWPVAVPAIEMRWVARVASAVISSTGAVALFFLGAVTKKPPHRLRVGICAALAYAFSWELAAHGRYGMTDASVAALTAWSAAFGVLYAARGRAIYALASVLVAGLAFAFKPPAMTAIALPLGYLVLFAPKRRGFWRVADRAILGSAIPIAIFVFIYFNPYYVSNWQTALSQFQASVAQYRTGEGIPEWGWHKPGLSHFRYGLWVITGHMQSNHVPLACLLSGISLVGLGRLIRRRDWVSLILPAYALMTTALSTYNTRLSDIRTFLIGGVAMALLFGHGVDTLAAWQGKLAQRVSIARPRLFEHGLTAAALLCAVVPTTIDSIRGQRLSKDSRIRAMEWIAKRGTTSPVGISPSVFDYADDARSAVSKYLNTVDIRSCQMATQIGPQYIVTASGREEVAKWPLVLHHFLFEACPGYVEVARFNENPYERTFWGGGETWDGRSNAVVLQRR